MGFMQFLQFDSFFTLFVVILIYYLVNFQLKLLAKEICIVVSMADIQDVHMAINVKRTYFQVSN